VADFVGKADGMVVDSAGTKASTEAVDSMVEKASAAVTGSTVVADSTEAAMEEASTAVGEEGFMAVAAPTAAVVIISR